MRLLVSLAGLALAAASLAACSRPSLPASPPPPSPGIVQLPDYLQVPDEDTSDDSKRVVVRAFAGWPAFSLRLPLGWEVRPLQGIDSYVGEIVGDDVRLGFDYGPYSPSLNPAEDDPAHEYIVTYEDIGGMEAKLVLPKDYSAGHTGVNFRRLGGPSLTIYGYGLTAEQQRTAFAVFRSIRTLASGLVAVEVSGLEPGDTATLTMRQLRTRDSPIQIRYVEGLKNGPWREVTHLAEGQYSLSVEAKGYASEPVAFEFRVPSDGVTWRYQRRFQLVRPEQARTVLGRPPFVSTNVSTLPSIQGTITAPQEFEGIIRIVGLPPAEGECYAQVLPCRSPFLPPEPVDEIPDIAAASSLLIELPVEPGTWGYLGPELPGGSRYLVTLVAPGYEVTPLGYIVPVSVGKVPHIVKGLDFTVQLSAPEPSPTPASAMPTSTPIGFTPLSLEFALDKPAYTLGDDIFAAVTVKNTWDRPFHLPDFPAKVRLEKIGSSSTWDVERTPQSGRMTMTPGSQIWAAITVPGSLTVGLEEGQYSIVVDVVLDASPECAKTERTFASPALTISSSPTPLANDPWPDLPAYTVRGETISAYVGEEFVVGQLRYAPRLGQHWYETHDADMLALVKATDVATPSTLGAATWYRFKAQKPGTSQIKLELISAGRPPLDQAWFDVTITTPPLTQAGADNGGD